MAFRTHTIEGIRRTARDGAGDSLASLPAGTVIGIFDNRIAAVGAAVQLTVDMPDAKVWVASGREASDKVTAARAARPFFSKLAGALSDDESFVQHIVAEVSTGRSVLVTEANRGVHFEGARQVIEFGRWATREVRR